MLDVAVRETKRQDRRRRDSRSLHRRGRRRVLCSFDRLHVRSGYGASGDSRHAPKLALASHLLADRRKDPTGEVILEVSVRVADQEGLCGNAAPPLVSTGRVPSCRSLKTSKWWTSISWTCFEGSRSTTSATSRVRSKSPGADSELHASPRGGVPSSPPLRFKLASGSGRRQSSTVLSA